jgi:hypothetical protein
MAIKLIVPSASKQWIKETHLRLDRIENEREFRESNTTNSDTHRLVISRPNRKRTKVDFAIKIPTSKERRSIGVSQVPNCKAAKPFERDTAKLSKQDPWTFGMNFEDPATIHNPRAEPEPRELGQRQSIQGEFVKNTKASSRRIRNWITGKTASLINKEIP